MPTIETLLGVDFMENECADVLLKDGMWDITGIPYLFVEVQNRSEELPEGALMFVEKYGTSNIMVGCAYETWGMVLLAGKPKEYTGWDGSFGHGACAVLSGCPRDLLIIAEND